MKNTAFKWRKVLFVYARFDKKTPLCSARIPVMFSGKDDLQMNKSLPKPLKKRSGKKRSFFSGQAAPQIKKYIFSTMALKCVCAFFMSRTAFIGGASPLGFSLFAASFGGRGSYACALSAVLGLVFSGKGLSVIGKYIIAIILYSLIQERFMPQKFKTPPLNALTGSLCMLVSGFFLLFADITLGGYPLIYDSVVLIVESATIWISVLAFSIALPLVTSIALRRSLTPEETVSLALFAGGVLCGFGSLGIPGVFSVTGTLCVLCVLLFAVRFGSMQGCSAGIIMGIVCCLSRGRIDACAASFALSGLCAGYFSKYGRWSACISFIMANAVVTILSNGSTEVLINIFDTALAAVILYSLPQRVFDTLNHFSTYSPPAFELASSKLRVAQGTIAQCEKSFRRISELRNNNEYNTLLLYRRTARKVCGNCGLRKYCWGRDAKATKDAMDILCQNLHDGETVIADNAPPHCLRKDQFVAEFMRMFEVYKNDCMWTEKINEFRGAVYNSFVGIADILGKSSEMLLNTAECDAVAADSVKSRLRRENILTGNVFVSGSKEETCVRIKLESCGGFGRCESAVCKILEEMLGMPFVRTGLRNCGDCTCTYVVKPSFSITTAVAGAIKANKKVSGDYALYALIDRHTYALILCDGMGSGETAREESRACARLLLKLIESGISPQSAINIINSMLLCAFSDSVAAIDLCLISLDDGSSQIYKCGGAGSYAKTKENVTHISSGTLPAGSFVNGDTGIYPVASERGSMVVLVSDGVSASESSRMPWIKDMITQYDGTEPEALAQMILKHAKELSGNIAADDLTILAAYIG